MSESFSGHDIETGLLQRVRSWRDLFPPIGLLPALRVAGSPLHVLMWLCWLVGIQLLLTYGTSIPVTKLPWIGTEDSGDPLAVWVLRLTGRDWLVLGVIELLSIFPAAISMRAGALYTAGRDGEGFTDTVVLALGRWKTLLQVTLLPWVCVVGLVLPLCVVALVVKIPTLGRVIAEMLALLSSPILLLIGMLAAGSIIAIPLALAAVTVEKRDDGFDALSRGYEYLFRRPVQTVLYLVSSWLLMIVVGSIFVLISFSALSVAASVMRFIHEPLAMLTVWKWIFTTLPLAALSTTKSAMFGAMYLLLRYDANSQDIEQLEMTRAERAKPTLPTL